MASRGLLSFAAFLATVLSVCAQPEPMMRMQVTPGGLVKAGDRLIISCFAENFGGGRLVKLHKYQPQAAAEVTLFSNDAIETKYQAVDRFSLTLNQTDPNKVAYGFYFAIDGAMAEDSGTYRCEITSTNAEDSQRIDVIEPPTEIELFIGDEQAEIAIDMDGQEVELEAGQRREIRCHVTGGNPAPEMKILAGDVDLTSEFEVNTRVTEHETGLEGMFKPEADVNVNTKNPDGLMMEYRFNGKQLGCYAYTQDQQEAAISRYFVAKFQGVPPEFVKCPSEVIGVTHQKNINITCTIRASPEATMSKISWLDKANDTISVKVGEDFGEHITAELEEVNGEMALVLYIHHAMPQTFREYIFTAENELGHQEHRVNFVRDPADPWIDGASTVTLSATLLCLLLAIQMFLHL